MIPDPSFHISSFVYQDGMPSPFMLDGRNPAYVISPSSEEEFQEAVLWAQSAGCALVPFGGGTQIAQGNSLRAETWAALSTSGWEGVVEYSPEDLVITVRAGTPLEDIQRVLQEHGQMLPFDPPFAAKATIGGVTATNSQGLWRPTYGLPRDRLLGLRFVTGDGRRAKAGGKVVKNVAGYDVCKLLAGSWGSLGVITEVTYKTHPLPAVRGILVVQSGDISALIHGALAVYRARLEPLYLVVTLQPEPKLFIGLAGNRDTCAWQASTIAELLAQHGLEATLQPDDAVAPMEDALRHAGADCAAALRLVTMPSDLSELLRRIVRVAQDTCHAAMVHVEVGVTDLYMGSAPAAKAVWAEAQAALPPAGRVLWRKVPPGLAPGDVWGSPADPVAFQLMARLKAQLDPAGILCPGRFVGRL